MKELRCFSWLLSWTAEQDEKPTTWPKGFLWVLVWLGQFWAKSLRRAGLWEEWQESVSEVRHCKRCCLAWLRSEEVEWWDAKAQHVQDKADQGDAFGVEELRNRGFFFYLGELHPAEVQAERDTWAKHCRRIGEDPGSVVDRVWANVQSYSQMDVVWEHAFGPNELHAALRQMSSRPRERMK